MNFKSEILMSMLLSIVISLILGKFIIKILRQKHITESRIITKKSNTLNLIFSKGGSPLLNQRLKHSEMRKHDNSIVSVEIDARSTLMIPTAKLFICEPLFKLK